MSWTLWLRAVVCSTPPPSSRCRQRCGAARCAAARGEPGLSRDVLNRRQKRWAFLKLVVRELGLDAEAERRRFEEIEPGRRWGLITARAVGRDGALLGWAREALVPGGEVVLWTTEEGENRLAEKTGWRVLSSALPGLERGRLCRLQPCFT